jgi:hypothetical protein
MTGTARSLGLRRMAFGCAALLLLPVLDAGAQLSRAGGAEPTGSPRDTAPIDMTGYWVSIVNEDWRWRMMTPPKGDYTSISMLSEQGKAEADRWEPAQDGSCKAYGAAGLLRMPTRLHVTWASDLIMQVDTDAGEQSRSFRFGAAAGAEPAGSATLQGFSTAEWIRAMRPPGRPRPDAAPPQGGSLKVTTTHLAPGWLRRNGVPYSDQTTLTEYFDRFAAPTGDEWLVVTTIVDDPLYLTDHFVTSTHFRREPDGSHWNPQPCRSD